MQPSSRSATPERSALGGRAGTLLGVLSAIPARIGSGHTSRKAEVRGRCAYEALCRKRPLPVWGGREHGVGAIDREWPTRTIASRDSIEGRFPELGSSVRKRIARGPSWGQGEGARPAFHQHVSCVSARHRHPPLHPFLHAALLTLTCPEGSEARIRPAWERHHAGPGDAPPSRALVRR